MIRVRLSNTKHLDPLTDYNYTFDSLLKDPPIVKLGLLWQLGQPDKSSQPPPNFSPLFNTLIVRGNRANGIHFEWDKNHGVKGNGKG
jgi:hypothetical protein